MSHAEDAYGNVKRLAFCGEVIAALSPRVVIDVGCGTGERLTRPLAERFPTTRFVGIDSDPGTVEYARARPPLANLEFAGDSSLDRLRGADVIIVSEVVEHVEEPEAFLVTLRALLGPRGRMIVTVPNGRGPFEGATLLETLFRVSGLLALARGMKRAVAGSGITDPLASRDTLAISPHINFFSHRQILGVFARVGLPIERYRPRTFLCGFVLDQVLASLRLLEWNARVADRLPAALASDWMFVLEPGAPIAAPPYRRGPVARWRRQLNERAFRAA